MSVGCQLAEETRFHAAPGVQRFFADADRLLDPYGLLQRRSFPEAPDQRRESN